MDTYKSHQQTRYFQALSAIGVAPLNGSNTPNTTQPFRILVVTSSHRGDDARIAFRQIEALLDAGAEIVYVAPPPEVHEHKNLRRILVDRSTGRRRLGSWRQVMVAIRNERNNVDLILVHDLELLLPIRLMRPRVPIVWDVHEDMPASVGDREWIPRILKRSAQILTSVVETIARRNTYLILAEKSYVDRLGGWPIVPNTTRVPPLPLTRSVSKNRIVYLGRISEGRGIRALIEIGRELGDSAELVVIGPADDDVRDLVTRAHADGFVHWRGPLPNPVALQEVSSCLVGLCLLDPLPNYVCSMPTKVFEYFAHGVTTVATPLPQAVSALTKSGAGTVVPFSNTESAVAAIRTYLDNPDDAVEEGKRAHQWVRANQNWDIDGPKFVAQLQQWIAEHRTR